MGYRARCDKEKDPATSDGSIGLELADTHPCLTGTPGIQPKPDDTKWNEIFDRRLT